MGGFSRSNRLVEKSSAIGCTALKDVTNVRVFRSLKDALQSGYSVYDRWDHGYIVRTRTQAGWALALVDLSRQSLPALASLDFDALARGGDEEC